MSSKTAARYDLIAAAYDVIAGLIPSRWRRRATGAAFGRVLEAGVGTGLNLPFYTERCREVVGIDISPGMLGRARVRAPDCRAPVRLELMDVQELAFEPGSFDCVVAAFVFCTVADPLAGLRECYRVLTPGGKLILLEHVGSRHKLLGGVMDRLNPVFVRLLDDNINRDTVGTVVEAGFALESTSELLGDVVRLIRATRRPEG